MSPEVLSTETIFISLVCLVLSVGVLQKQAASPVMATEAIPKPLATLVASMEVVPVFTPERAHVTTLSPRRAVGLMSGLERASDSEPSPERAPVLVDSPERAPVPEFSPRRAPVPEFSQQRAPVPVSAMASRNGSRSGAQPSPCILSSGASRAPPSLDVVREGGGVMSCFCLLLPWVLSVFPYLVMFLFLLFINYPWLLLTCFCSPWLFYKPCVFLSSLVLS